MPRRLLRTAKRAAVISGSATAASNLMNRRERERLLAQEAARSASAAAPRERENSHAHDNDMVSALERLAHLKASGALSDKEFAAAKAKLLSP